MTMKKLSLLTAIYSLIVSIVLLIAPLFTMMSIVGDAIEENASASATMGVDSFFRIMAGIMLILAIILMFKSKTSSLAGKILLIIAGGLVVMFSSLLGFVAGICGIVGAGILLATNKNMITEDTEI
ncbi:hypothetical protein [Mycoplasma sp. P36-A1]|uniref:hypothetical protein n=1 Tax=Mycoplasma sp. P36-A1 TaxID=3252900 RepID=UPI003C2CC15F